MTKRKPCGHGAIAAYTGQGAQCLRCGRWALFDPADGPPDEDWFVAQIEAHILIRRAGEKMACSCGRYDEAADPSLSPAEAWAHHRAAEWSRAASARQR